MFTQFKKAILGTTLLAGLAVGSTGCSTNAGTGALVGGAIGAGTGAIIGHNSHGRTAGGALIGGAVGALAGAAIGDAQDKKEARDGRYYERRPAPPPPPDYYQERVTRYGPNGEVITETRTYRRD
jgi:hypothetical protein